MTDEVQERIYYSRLDDPNSWNTEPRNPVCAPRDYCEPVQTSNPNEDTLTERDRKLRVKRWDKIVLDRLGFGASVSPYAFVFGAGLKWWPCISGLAFQVTIGPAQFYVCWILNPEARYRA